MNAITPIEGAECLQVETDADHEARLESLALDIEMTIQVAEWRVGQRLRDARAYISVARTYEGKSRIVRDFPPTVLYALSAPSTPEDVRTEVERMIADGEVVRAADVKRNGALVAEIVGHYVAGWPEMSIRGLVMNEHPGLSDEAFDIAADLAWTEIQAGGPVFQRAQREVVEARFLPVDPVPLAWDEVPF